MLESSDYDRPPSITPDVSNLDLDPDINGTKVAGDLAKGTVRGALMGAFEVLNKGCASYQFVRKAEYGAKIYKVAALVKYAPIFMALIDKMRAGDGVWSEMGYIGSILMRPSTMKDSYGKHSSSPKASTLSLRVKLPTSAD